MSAPNRHPLIRLLPFSEAGEAISAVASLPEPRLATDKLWVSLIVFVADEVASTRIDLEDTAAQTPSWNERNVKHKSDRSALQSVQQQLQDKGYRRTLAEHWSKVQAAKRDLHTKRIDSQERRKRRKKLRKALAKRWR